VDIEQGERAEASLTAFIDRRDTERPALGALVGATVGPVLSLPAPAKAKLERGEGVLPIEQM
jgi:hypothetical protein